MPSRSMRVKREPVPIDDDDDLLQTPTVPTTTTTTKMPVRAASVASNARPTSNSNSSTTINGDVDMIDTNGISSAPGNSIGMEAIGNNSRQLIQAIQMLEALNIDATLPSLPKFVVIGDQSAGKSSIIEAVSGITLPRSAGTCTRCPFKITTTAAKNGEPWTCKVSLHHKYAFTSKDRPGTDAEGPFIGWAEQKDLTIVDFATVFDKAQLELTLRRAQLAILNPHKNFVQFLNCSVGADSDEQRVRFSPNVISLEIVAAGLPDLSFYDLPGAINTLGDESQQHLVDFVEKLIKAYIQEEKALILLACGANQDMETSTACRYLFECRAQLRAMGVLTKPDLMDNTTNRVAFLKNLLSGRTHNLKGGGWYVTRQLSQTELDQQTAYADARQLEGAFFSGDLWTISLANYAHRFGIANLQTALSKKLIAHILGDLPEITARVQAQLSYINEQLATFPEKENAPTMSVVMEIDSVKSSLVLQLNADSRHSDMRKGYRKVFRDLFGMLQALKPKVDMTTPGYQKPSITVESSDPEDEDTPSKSRRMNNGRAMSVVCSTPSRSDRPARRTPATSSRSSTSRVAANFGRAVFRLGEVKAKFYADPGADLPTQTSQLVVRELISEALVGWASAADGALKKVREIFTKMLETVIVSALAQRQTTALFHEVERITHSLFEELFQNVEETVHKLIAGETHRPITYSSEALEQKQASHKAEYRKERQEKRVAEYAETLEAETGKMMPVPEQKKKAADALWIMATLGADEYERELEALATPAAYYEIASATLVDTIARQFEIGLMHAYETRIHRELLEELQATDHAHCAHLLAEDPERELQRAQLLAEQAKLEQALGELNRLPASHLSN